eukprot:scaffold9208_cov68-Phaeocystis_antarctica.AAC.4
MARGTDHEGQTQSARAHDVDGQAGGAVANHARGKQRETARATSTQLLCAALSSAVSHLRCGQVCVDALEAARARTRKAAMGRCGQLVIGPAGSGKSTYCELMRNHIETLNRRVHVVNLDPAAEHFRYPVAADIRDLISLEDVMTEMKLGPNGGLIYCMERGRQPTQTAQQLRSAPHSPAPRQPDSSPGATAPQQPRSSATAARAQHRSLRGPQDVLDDLGGDEYVLFDCPGQIELYSHVPAMQQLTQELTLTLTLTLTLNPNANPDPSRKRSYS